MPRIAHGESVTPEQLEQAQEALASQADNLDVAFAVGSAPALQSFDFMFPELQTERANLLTTSPNTVIRLKKLGRAMADPGGADPGDSNVPAIYTYFGQFVDHDITLERTSFGGIGQLLNDDLAPMTVEAIRADLKNLRTASLDLDSVYGPAAPRLPSNRNKLLIGKVTEVGGRPPGKGDDNDLPRHPPDPRPQVDRAARLGDPRNDENLILSQLHLAFLKAHNRLVDQGRTFEQARRILRQHYQHIVLHDFLKNRVADRTVVVDVLTNGNRFYHPEVEPFFLPLEFTVAGFRFGHTMVRDEYDYNLNFSPASLDLLFTFTALSGQLGEFDTLPENWIIQWERFIATGGGRNKARKLDTKLAGGLFHLRKITGEEEGNPEDGEENDAANLAVRNLLRGYGLRMPTGQAVANAMELPALTPAQVQAAAANPRQVEVLKAGRWLERTPLWYYLLAEAKHHGGNRLGPVGSRLVAEVLVGLAWRSEDSILRVPNWAPSLPSAHKGAFVLADLLRFAKVA